MDLEDSAQVQLLLERFEQYLSSFDRRCPFDEAKVASHRATIKQVRDASQPVDVLDEMIWFQKLRDTLIKWGMNSRGASLRDLETIRANFIKLRPHITEIQHLHIETIDPYYLVTYGRKISYLLENLHIGNQGTKLVVNSKALHHLLPDLVPPIDREYTLSFFYFDSNIVQRHSAQHLFEEMWPAFHKIASVVKEKPIVQSYLQSSLDQGMHTSIPKIIDNAIVGYVRTPR